MSLLDCVRVRVRVCSCEGVGLDRTQDAAGRRGIGGFREAVLSVPCWEDVRVEGGSEGGLSSAALLDWILGR